MWVEVGIVLAFGGGTLAGGNEGASWGAGDV